MAPRPTAFEVSFPGEAARARIHDSSERGGHKRLAETGVGSLREDKRLRQERDIAAPRHYNPPADLVPESTDLILEGEDDEDDETPKPVRLLLDFVIFDTRHDSVTCRLDASEAGRKFEATGLALAAFVNEQDEDEVDGEGMRIRISDVRTWTIDYTKPGDPLYIETPHAFYILESPAHIYRATWDTFIRRHRISQLVLSSALSEPRQDPGDFLYYFTTTWDDISEQYFTESDLRSSTPAIKDAISRCKARDGKRLLGTTVICWLFADPSQNQVTYDPTQRQSESRLSGNPDLAVLQPRNQNPTHVTPLIASLAANLFRERLIVVGPPPPRKDRAELQQEKEAEKDKRDRLFYLLSRVRQQRRVVRLQKVRASRQVRMDQPVLRVDDVEYSIGDVLIIPISDDAGSTNPPPDFPDGPDKVPPDARITDYFWFAVLVHLHPDREKMHVRWLHHSSKTILGEISDTRECFLTDICDDVPLQMVQGKVNIRYIPTTPREKDLGVHEYFYKFTYKAGDGSFHTITPSDLPIPPHSRNPFNDCAGCRAEQLPQEHMEWTKINCGIHYIGADFHVHDYVLLRNEGEDEESRGEKGGKTRPAHVGLITQIVLPPPARMRRGQQPAIEVKMLGRIGDIADKAPPDLGMIKDERHLYVTDEYRNFPLSYLLGRCLVEHKRRIPDFDLWIASSPKHFFVQYAAPRLAVQSWADVRQLRQAEVDACPPCYDAEMRRMKELSDFLGDMEEKPLRVLDPFAGVGAFGMGLEESGVVRMTYAIEISPSAAKTLRRNSSHTTVYNQCSNKVLQWAVKRHAGIHVDRLHSIGDSQPLPNPPMPGEIDMIVAGFPCQPHSRLNMFQRADDRKSNLILNLLSWVDFLRPRFCYFENVRGFLSFNLMTYQHSRYTVKGGIEMGGLKFLVRVLLAMNYQVRFTLLQAGHYGSPQTRVRFFLVAASNDQHLPSFPQPTHDFPPPDNLDIKTPNGDVLHWLRMTRGTAPHPAVTVQDAISDLLRFDWRHPTLDGEPPNVRRQLAERARTIPQFNVDLLSQHAGPELRGSNVKYECGPKTGYQLWCRGGARQGEERAVKDLQHFTRVLKPATVQRVVKIPLRPRADYRSLPRNLQEWLADNPYSANARQGFKPGLYGRIDGESFFSTTVTNMEPTAKQRWVLHPDCKRTVTVRELARSQGFPDWFMFYALQDSVKTMHRQIGNAVPWPVSMALGRELRDSLFQHWKDQKNETALNEDD
ncbi:S-adenosyl-L-methionine-dependent methyltransferase [Heliocybe sulcata]|uniref:DNA (cytosine-5-)-methyltransferase n=1 Tax=Heliocybe sulcata TaxID=5364 RepID=A0A5C3NF23_9AGAM|nr:S-adenosyl-L-methionine-dependent methyltransferase [Heliocybe sulcata]